MSGAPGLTAASDRPPRRLGGSLPLGEDRDLAVENRDLIEDRMTPAQVAEAQRLAREWKPK